MASIRSCISAGIVIWGAVPYFGTFNIASQYNIKCTILVVPRHHETGGDFVLSSNHIHEVVVVFFSLLFDAKAVNNKAESDGTPFVREQTGGVLGLVVAYDIKVLNEALVVKKYSLGKATHDLSNLNNDVVIMNKIGKILLLYDGVI